MKNGFFVLATMTALVGLVGCSGSGGGGGGGSSTTPSYVKSAKIQCGTKDCLSGSNVGSMSAKSTVHAMTTASYYTIELKDVFNTAKSKVAEINNYITLLNGMADDNGVQSCETIPTTGTLTYAGYTVELGTGGGSFNMGNGARVPDHSVKLTDNNSITYISFKCGTPQFVWLVREDLGTSNRDEFLYELNTSTNAIVISWGATASAGINSLGYFNSDGTDSFSFAYFDYANNPAGGYNHSFVGGAKPFTMAHTGAIKPASETFEFAYSYGNTAQTATAIDSVAWGENTGSPLPISYRGCVSLYRTGSPQMSDYSCSYDGTTAGTDVIKNFKASDIVAPPVGNASSWSPAEAGALALTDPASL